MLCQFNVKNFQCIQDEVSLDMQATSITENENTLLVDSDGEKFLPLGVIYGPNGAGKSTVLSALYSLICKVMRPICAVNSDNKDCLQTTNNTAVIPFKFSKDSVNAPTEYEIFFRTKNYEYQYSLSVFKGKIIDETLYKKSLAGGRYTLVFSRKGSNSIILKGTMKSYSCNEISDNLPLLSYLGITHRRNIIIKDIINWFHMGIEYIDYSNPKTDNTVPVAESKAIKSLVLKMLIEMDIDISDYRIVEKDNKINVFTKHQVSGLDYELQLEEESNGTIKLFGILPYIADSLLNGITLVVDELDAKLHPLLLKHIIELYNNPISNKNRAQLIFTSHDLTTMNSENFRRDEIWFIAKNKRQAAKMYSLVEFKKEDGTVERKGAIYDKNYLKGQYGADPYLQRIINWEEV